MSFLFNVWGRETALGANHCTSDVQLNRLQGPGANDCVLSASQLTSKNRLQGLGSLRDMVRHGAGAGMERIKEEEAASALIMMSKGSPRKQQQNGQLAIS